MFIKLLIYYELSASWYIVYLALKKMVGTRSCDSRDLCPLGKYHFPILSKNINSLFLLSMNYKIYNDLIAYVD